MDEYCGLSFYDYSSFLPFLISPQSAMTTLTLVAPLELPYVSIVLTTSIPFSTLPKTTCLQSNHLVGAVVKKN